MYLCVRADIVIRLLPVHALAAPFFMFFMGYTASPFGSASSVASCTPSILTAFPCAPPAVASAAAAIVALSLIM